MNPEEYTYLYELEEHHWWFVGMRKIVAALLDPGAGSGSARILDAGCGTGFMLSWLRRYSQGGQVVGVDVSRDALDFSGRRGERLLIQASVAELPLPSNTFDLVLSFDVLDSFSLIEGARPFAELARVLKEGGLLFVRVPAFQILYSEHDRAVVTAHRYTAGELAQNLLRQGLKLERVTYANIVLFPVAALWRLLRSFRREGEMRSDVKPLPKAVRWANRLLVGILGVEAAWLRHLRWRLPMGLSVIALARKPSSGI